MNGDMYMYISVYIYMNYSALKRKASNCNDMDETGGRYAKRNKQDTKREILCDLTYMWNLKQAHSQKQRVGWLLPRAGNGLMVVKSMKFQLYKFNKFWRSNAQIAW